MPAIMPVSTLRSYTEVLEDVRPGSPVFLTKNGHGRYAILDMSDYDRLVSERVVAGILDRVGAARESPLATAPLDAVCRARTGWRFAERHGYLAL